MPEYSFETINNLVTGEKEVVGNTSGIHITDFRSIIDAAENSLVWLSPKKKEMIPYVASTPAKLIIVSNEFDTTGYPDKCFIKVTDPRLAFIRIISALQSPKPEWGVHPTASVHPDAKVHPQSYIGAYSYVGKCEIGEGSVVVGHCYLYDGVKIGRNVRIHAGAVIGTDGFGYQRNDTGVLEKFPHVGGVTIGDDVEIGANVCIDRGTLSDTIIGDGVKIDNLAHIAHNSQVGRQTVITASVTLSGSVKVGEFCWLAPSSVILENIKIGNRSRIGIGAVVTKDVPENANMMGNPAINFKM